MNLTLEECVLIIAAVYWSLVMLATLNITLATSPIALAGVWYYCKLHKQKEA